MHSKATSFSAVCATCVAAELESMSSIRDGNKQAASAAMCMQVKGATKMRTWSPMAAQAPPTSCAAQMMHPARLHRFHCCPGPGGSPKGFAAELAAVAEGFQPCPAPSCQRWGIKWAGCCSEACWPSSSPACSACASGACQDVPP
jgi:hypothetical protein